MLKSKNTKKILIVTLFILYMNLHINIDENLLFFIDLNKLKENKFFRDIF